MRKHLNKFLKALSVLMAFMLMLCMIPAEVISVSAAESYKSTVTFTFTDSGVAVSDSSASGFEISGTELTITDSGVYTVTGKCSNGNIAVKKGTTSVVLILENLTLSCDYSAPVVSKKNTATTIFVSGNVTLTDNEDPANETSSDVEVADAFEGAGIKAKSGSTLRIEGNGTLTVDGSKCKNGIKGAAETNVIVDMGQSGTLNITSANSGLASDGEVIIKGGNLNIKSADEGIKSEPDTDDTVSKGAITVSGGNIKVDTLSLSGGDGIQAANGITITGGSFDIDSNNDAIQSNTDIKISNGSFDLTSLKGYNSSFDANTVSCKGIKAAATDEDVENATNLIEISGGTFKINTPDDAIHSDGTVEVTGGTFEISTGDDAIHADTTLNLGSENSLERDPFITVNNSYEGFEAGTVNIYGGKLYVVSSDDGMNSAGGATNGNTTVMPGGGFGGGKDHFNPGGNTATGSYSLNIYGGLIYVNAGGDGLDSNGALNLTGGTIEVWGSTSGADEPLDSDGTLTVNGAKVFAAGSSGMGQIRPSGSQSYTSSSTRITAGNVVTVKANNSAVYTTTAPKSVSYSFFSAPSVSNASISTSNGNVSCSTANAWSHSFNSGVVTKAATDTATGIMTYTCSSCGYSERQTIPMLFEDSDDEVVTPVDEGYKVSFNSNGSCKIDVYYTHDYSAADESNVTSAVSRSSSTGNPDSTGDGQVNFTVIPSSGYVVESITATDGLYKNIKDVSLDSGIANTYRVTKITGNLTITVNLTAVSTDATEPDGTTVTVPATSVDNVSTEPTETTVITDNSTTVTVPASTDATGNNTYPTTKTEPSETTPDSKPETSTSTIPDTSEGYILGDADSNGKVNVKDATVIQKVLAKFEGVTCNMDAAMTNSNDRLDIGDATMIQKYLAFMLKDTLIGTYITK